MRDRDIARERDHVIYTERERERERAREREGYIKRKGESERA